LLAVCTLVYILVSGLLAGVVPFSSLNVGSPIADVRSRLDYASATRLIAAGAMAGRTTVMLALYLRAGARLFGHDRRRLCAPAVASNNGDPGAGLPSG